VRFGRIPTKAEGLTGSGADLIDHLICLPGQGGVFGGGNGVFISKEPVGLWNGLLSAGFPHLFVVPDRTEIVHPLGLSGGAAFQFLVILPYPASAIPFLFQFGKKSGKFGPGRAV